MGVLLTFFVLLFLCHWLVTVIMAWKAVVWMNCGKALYIKLFWNYINQRPFSYVNWHTAFNASLTVQYKSRMKRLRDFMMRNVQCVATSWANWYFIRWKCLHKWVFLQRQALMYQELIKTNAIQLLFSHCCYINVKLKLYYLNTKYKKYVIWNN